MNKKFATATITILLVITAVLWSVTRYDTKVASICLIVICAVIAVDSVVDYLKRKPVGKRPAYQLGLSVVGCTAVIIYLLYSLVK